MPQADKIADNIHQIGVDDVFLRFFAQPVVIEISQADVGRRLADEQYLGAFAETEAVDIAFDGGGAEMLQHNFFFVAIQRTTVRQACEISLQLLGGIALNEA